MVPNKFTGDFCHNLSKPQVCTESHRCFFESDCLSSDPWSRWFTMNIFDLHGFADEGLYDVCGNVCFYI